MDILIADTKEVYRHQIERELGENCSSSEVLDYIFGTYENDYRAESDLVLRRWDKCDKTVLQRLNMFWAIPLTIALSPFMYIKNGVVGWDTTTKLGRFILRVTGHLK